MRFLIGVVALLLLAAQPVFAADWNVDKGGVFSKGTGAVLHGYDPVAYFTDGKPMPGSPDFTAQHDGATFRFTSAAHRDAFVADPARYLPQYGGYCAWAVSQGYTADIDPQAWRIVDGRLYLNYDTGIQKKWEKDIPGNIGKADVNWPKLGGAAPKETSP